MLHTLPCPVYGRMNKSGKTALSRPGSSPVFDREFVKRLPNLLTLVVCLLPSVTTEHRGKNQRSDTKTSGGSRSFFFFISVNESFHFFAHQRTVKSCIKAALDQKPHFLQTEVAHKPHSNRSHKFENGDPISSMLGQILPLFACQNVYILNRFCDIHKVKFSFHCTCYIVPDCFHGFFKFKTLHINRTNS